MCQVFQKRGFCTKKTECKLMPAGHWVDPNNPARKRAREDVGDDADHDEPAGAAMRF